MAVYSNRPFRHWEFEVCADSGPVSRSPLVEELSATASSKTITGIIKTYCAMFGRPDEIISDNGPQYSGECFKRFTNDWNIKYVTSSPNYPRSN